MLLQFVNIYYHIGQYVSLYLLIRLNVLNYPLICTHLAISIVHHFKNWHSFSDDPAIKTRKRFQIIRVGHVKKSSRTMSRAGLTIE